MTSKVFMNELNGKITLGTLCVDVVADTTHFVGVADSYINTQSGRHFNYQRPRAEDICIDDIATALSHECRFAGHTEQFYSVAQHSVLVSTMLPPELALEGLLHDAMEAYYKDIPTPLKSLMPGYKKLEAECDAIIRNMFNLPPAMSPQVKHCDLIALATERRDLGLDDGVPWPQLDGLAPLEEPIIPLLPAQARARFMARFNELTARIK
ncbi:HD family hydrolase [Plesiomonas shigelloides]|uniref:HD family hydrolase n=1 Tax=Plesiomonas shigelloides TaxID=703 RepID=UPI00387F0AD9